MFDKIKLNIILSYLFNNKKLYIDIKNPFGYQCTNCNNIVYASARLYEETDRYYKNTVICPHCRKLIVLHQESAMYTFTGKR